MNWTTYLCLPAVSGRHQFDPSRPTWDMRHSNPVWDEDEAATKWCHFVAQGGIKIPSYGELDESACPEINTLRARYTFYRDVENALCYGPPMAAIQFKCDIAETCVLNIQQPAWNW